MDKDTQRKTRVLFFAWGDSIHARRRIRIFTEDPAFEVGVISNFAYDFENAENFYLIDSGRVNSVSYFKNILRMILAMVIYFCMHLRDRKTKIRECYSLIADTSLTRKYAKEFKPDIIFLQTLLYPCYLSYVLPRKIPLIITFWNGDVTWWAKWNGVERLFKKKIVEYGVNRAVSMTVNSQAAYNACLDYGVAAEKIHLIRYPGVDLTIFKPGSRLVARKKLSITSEKVILCPRGVGGYLNSDVIIEAAATVIAQKPETMFLFISGAGGDEVWQQHMKRAAELGVADHFRRDGQVAWELMPAYYQAADAIISISSNDSLPNCMLEGMACEAPLIMGDIPQIREWITHEVNGILVPPRDAVALSEAILLLLKNSRLKETFVQYNIELVNREFDSRKNSLLVKQLVHEITRR